MDREVIDAISRNIYFRGTNLWGLLRLSAYYLKFNRNIGKPELQRLESWLHERLGGDKMKIVIEK